MPCSSISEVALVPDAAQISALFERLFKARYRTVLLGGAEEPLYLPADATSSWHRIYYREDFAASALHETAHWCIAGARRRRLEDYGYWYRPDGRDARSQHLFEQVEARPQALEWLFARAAGVPFRVSLDNLEGEADERGMIFRRQVWWQARRFCREGLPPRAARFREALVVAFDGVRRCPDAADVEDL